LSNVVTSVNTSVPCKGNGKTLGLETTSGNNFGLTQGGSGGIAYTASYGVNKGTSVSLTGLINNSISIGITTDSSESGIVGTVTRTQINCKYIIKY